MSARPILELDDPLVPRRPAVAPAPEPGASGGDEHPPPAAGPPRRRVRRPQPEPGAESTGRAGDSLMGDLEVVGETKSFGAAAEGAWRQWAGGTRVASYRLPDELLEELDDRARRLGVPIGMTVAAGLLHLFDQNDDTVVALVERAEDARVIGRRAARRGISTGS